MVMVVALTVKDEDERERKKEKNRSGAGRSTQGNDDGAQESTKSQAGHDTTRHIATKRGLVNGC